VDPLNEHLVLVGGHGPEYRGALLAIHRTDQGYEVEEIDPLTTCGISAANGRLFRILSSSSDEPRPELLIYDEHGIAAYRRLDGLEDPHGLLWDGERFVVPCSEANEIVWLDFDGHPVDRWRAPGVGDAWHVNGVHVRDGVLYASAFGMFADNAEMRRNIGEPTGVVFEVASQRVILSGLRCPHDPLFIDGEWSICESRANAILRVNEQSGERTRVADLGGWTRGVAVDSQHLYVGISAQRYGDQHSRASLAVLDRATSSVVGRIALPCFEVHAVAVVPRTFLAALRRGFRTNAHRTAVQDREELFRLAGNIHPRAMLTPMDELAPEDCDVDLTVKLPHRAVAGSAIALHATVYNRGTETLLTALPKPVSFAWRWERIEGEHRTIVAEGRAPLPSAIPPKGMAEARLLLDVPPAGGEYSLRLSLVQEWIRWFDDVTPAAGVSGLVILDESPVGEREAVEAT
jgi:hypothetical protein